jgi:chromatin assembly factor 1 subunit B
MTWIGEMLASAGDDGNVLLWVPSESSMAAMGDGVDHTDDKETWRIKHMCRTSTGAEIYDLAWSPDGQYFITGGVDNTARIFNAHTGTKAHSLSGGLLLTFFRLDDPANSRTQPLCSRRCMGSTE